jgi:hypothetical protein
MSLILVHLVTAAFGTGIWQYSLLGIELRWMLFLLTLFTLSSMLLRVFITVFVEHKSASVAGSSVVSPVFSPVVLMMLMHFTYRGAANAFMRYVVVVRPGTLRGSCMLMPRLPGTGAGRTLCWCRWPTGLRLPSVLSVLSCP